MHSPNKNQYQKYSFYEPHIYTQCIGVLRENLVLLLQGLTFNDVIQKSVFVADQREIVVDVIRRIEPNFEAHSILPDMCYACNLLHELNSEDRSGKVSCLENL
jgi:hypothetical protein